MGRRADTQLAYACASRCPPGGQNTGEIRLRDGRSLAYAEYWIEALDDARPTWIEGAGHLALETHVGEVVEAMSS
jgi:hypothetical protein